jgi:hypothetical protein
MMVGFLLEIMMVQDRTCGKGDCEREAVGFIGKFGETRTVGSPVNTPPGTPISASYCAEHESYVKRFLELL